MQPRPSTCNVAASGTKRNGPPQLAKAVANFCLAESNTKWDLPSCRHWQKCLELSLQGSKTTCAQVHIARAPLDQLSFGGS